MKDAIIALVNEQQKQMDVIAGQRDELLKGIDPLFSYCRKEPEWSNGKSVIEVVIQVADRRKAEVERLEMRVRSIQSDLETVTAQLQDLLNEKAARLETEAVKQQAAIDGAK